jgi:hypothetical protein
VPNNYRQFFDGYFANESKFMIERDLEGAFEKQTIRATSKTERLRIEIIYGADNGKYQHLHHIRFKHPKSVGFAHWQNSQKSGFGNQFVGFSPSKLTDLQELLEERLGLGWQETVYYNKKKHYKSRIALPSKIQPKIYVWRREQVGLLHILLSSFFGKLYRIIKRGFETKTQTISCHYFSGD